MLLFEKSSKIKIIIITETSVEKVAMMIRKKQKQVLFASIDALTSLILVKSKMRFVMNRLYTLSCLFLNTQNPLECVYVDISCLNLISIYHWITKNGIVFSKVFTSRHIYHIDWYIKRIASTDVVANFICANGQMMIFPIPHDLCLRDMNW